MEITDDAILHIIEDSFFLEQETPGRLEFLDFDGVRGRYSPLVSSPFSNVMVKTKLTPANADSVIQTVRDQFAAWNKAFGWMVIDSTTPADMAQRLQVAGFAKAFELAWMSLNVNHPITANPAVRVRRAVASDAPVISDLFHRAYPVPKSVSDNLVSNWQPTKDMKYLAYVEGVDEPVAVASQTYFPDKPITLLGGAATLPEYRGWGIYTSLVAHRLKSAGDDGIQTAVIRATRGTSAPICQKLGFTEQCSIDIYVWTPPEA